MIFFLTSDTNYGSAFFNAIDNMLNGLIHTFQANSMAFGPIAKNIGIMGLVILVFWTAYKPLSGNGPLDTSKIGRLFLVILGITFYSTFLIIINKPLDLINNGLKAIADTSEQNNDWYFDYEMSKITKESINSKPIINKIDGEKVANLLYSVDEKKGGPPKDVISLFDTTIESINNIASKTKTIASFAMSPTKIFKSLELAVVEGLYEFFILLGKISATLLNTTRAFLLISLSILGIIVIALSAFPGLERSFMKWLQFYITVYIWTGIAHLLRYVLSELYTEIKVVSGSGSLGDAGMIILENKFIVPVALAAIAGNAMIPKLANMVIQTGMSSVGTALTKANKAGSSSKIDKHLTK